MERLRVNNGRYGGECIEIDDVLRRMHSLAVEDGWTVTYIDVSGSERLPAFHRAVPGAARNIYISTGVHGDEPAGPLAVLELFERKAWPDTNLCVIPCLNQHGFVLNCRGDKDGVDLNRDYREPKTAVVQAHVRWLQLQPFFDLTLLLHEDWESDGFYLYELNPSRRPSIARAIVDEVKHVCPIDYSPVIEGRPASGGVICANPDLQVRRDWPEAFYLIHNKTKMSYTLEAPSDFRLETRVAALVTGVSAALKAATV